MMESKEKIEFSLVAPVNAPDELKDRLSEVAVDLSDDELAYASVWFYEELLLRKEHLEKELLEQEEFTQWDAENLKNIIED